MDETTLNAGAADPSASAGSRTVSGGAGGAGAGRPAAIEVEGAVKRYGRTTALDGVDLRVEQGAFYALLGPNGAGKTTLVHILCTIHRPDAGRARIDGWDVVRRPVRARRSLGVVFQEPSVDDRLTVRENLDFHGLIYGVPRALRRRRVPELLELVELADWRDKLVRSLSSGMKRRLEIARALVHDAHVLVLDEPTVGLDVQSRERIWEHVGRLRRERSLTVVVTTHYIEEVEACDRVCIIDGGRILAEDTPEALKERSGRELVRVRPRDGAGREALLAELGDAVVSAEGDIVAASAGPAFVERLLDRCAPHIRELSVERPSLQSVFLALTGRELRDREAGARERTRQFGRRGGEHTR